MEILTKNSAKCTIFQSTICNKFSSLMYLAKYIAGIDEGNVIYVAPGNDYAGGKPNITPELVLHSDFYHAPKVTGSKINIKKRQKESKYSKYPDG
jgi:hypothetical protein